MADEAKVTPEVEVKTPAEKAPAESEAAKPEEKKEQTIAEAMGSESEGKDNKPETVGLDKFIGEKKARKAAEKELAALRKSIEGGAPSSEISEDIDALAEEHNIDKNFLKKFAAGIEAKAERKLDEKISERLKPVEEREKQQKIDKAFDEHFGKAMESMPEYKDIVNPQVIKVLSLRPENANKTFAQLIDETYSKAVGGKRTTETYTPGGGKEPGPLDVDKARKDPKYFEEVMKNPKLKEQYNAEMLKRGV